MIRGLVTLLLCSISALSLIGCGAITSPTTADVSGDTSIGALKGSAYGGQQPIVGARLYLYAAGTRGNGGNGIAASTANASTSLLNASVLVNSPLNSGIDTNGNYYVLSGAGGNFSISGDYTCTVGTQVYLYAVGGSSDGGADTNTGIGLLAGLGQCPASGNLASQVPFLVINEVSTVAAAYALAGFASDATHISSDAGVGTNTTASLAATGIANGMANVANLVNIGTGGSRARTVAGSGAVPQTTINTLANILAACVNTTGVNSSSCVTLFGNATADGTSAGAKPSDTATAAIYVAHNPGVNVAALYGLQSSTPPFMPDLSTQPTDFTVGLTFSGGGMLALSDSGLAVDGSGNVWIPTSNNTIVELSSAGAFLSGTNGYSLGSFSSTNYGGCAAIDLAGNTWISNNTVSSVSELSASGDLLSPSGGYTSGGISGPSGIAIDASDNVWVANESSPSVTKLSSSGSPLSGVTGYSGNGISVPIPLAIDTSGDAWVGDYGNVTELSNAGAFLSGSNGYTSSNLARADALAIDSTGSAWVAGNSGSTGTLAKISSGGNIQAVTFSATYTPTGLAIDGNGNVWVGVGFTSLLEYANSGALVSPANGYTQGLANRGVAVDGSGNIWLGTESGVTEVVGAATPVVTPLAKGVVTNKLGTRP